MLDPKPRTVGRCKGCMVAALSLCSESTHLLHSETYSLFDFIVNSSHFLTDLQLLFQQIPL